MVFRGGREYFELLFQKISEARVFIHIQVYILAKDETGNRLLEQLFAAANRGVKVYLMVDAYGTNWVKRRQKAEWEAKGLKVKIFSSHVRFKRLVLGRRQHSKFVVIDNEWMTVTGLNFADRYSGFDGKEPWLDAAANVTGPAVAVLNRITSVYWKRRETRYLTSHAPARPLPNGMDVQVLCNDWLRNRLDVRRMYMKALSNAKKEILIIAAYFFPPTKLLTLLEEKARQGVKVTLVFTAHSDVPFIKPAMEYFYDSLSRAGVEIREWESTILHAKVAFVDDNWVTLGSYNLNQLSDFGSLETNLAFNEPSLVQAILKEFDEKIYPNTRLIKEVDRRIPHQLSRFLSFLLIRLSLKLLMLTNRQPR